MKGLKAPWKSCPKSIFLQRSYLIFAACFLVFCSWNKWFFFIIFLIFKLISCWRRWRILLLKRDRPISRISHFITPCLPFTLFFAFFEVLGLVVNSSRKIPFHSILGGGYWLTNCWKLRRLLWESVLMIEILKRWWDWFLRRGSYSWFKNPSFRRIFNFILGLFITVLLTYLIRQ